MRVLVMRMNSGSGVYDPSTPPFQVRPNSAIEVRQTGSSIQVWRVNDAIGGGQRELLFSGLDECLVLTFHGAEKL